MGDMTFSLEVSGLFLSLLLKEDIKAFVSSELGTNLTKQDSDGKYP